MQCIGSMQEGVFGTGIWLCLSYGVSPPAGGERGSTGRRRGSLAVGVRLPDDLKESTNFRMAHDGRRLLRTYATVRLLADELVLEGRAGRDVHAHGPCGVRRGR